MCFFFLFPCKVYVSSSRNITWQTIWRGFLGGLIQSGELHFCAACQCDHNYSSLSIYSVHLFSFPLYLPHLHFYISSDGGVQVVRNYGSDPSFYFFTKYVCSTTDTHRLFFGRQKLEVVCKVVIQKDWIRLLKWYRIGHRTNFL